MYAETTQRKYSAGRVAVGLLCALAVCCSVMYLSADEEFMHETVGAIDAGTSVGNTDVLKAGQIYTNTPRGNMRLMDYFTNVENDIAQEVSHRKQDIFSVRAQMARDAAFNSGARAKLKRNMLHKMAINAKIARRSLTRAMRRTQMRMHAVAKFQNRRNSANKRRDAKTMKYINADAAEQKRHLKLAVKGWQTATNAWAAKTQAKIKRMNAHAAANAAQISENAKKARKDLANTMHEWDHKTTNFAKNEKNANSKLGAQFKAQSKATRAWANNKIKAMVAQEGSKFDNVETKMAKNRHEVDMALKHITMQLSAAMNSQKALESKRFASETANIAAQRKRAAAQVAGMTAGFKVQLLATSSTIREQVTKINDRVDKTAGTIRSDAARTAKRNAHINAEMTNMIKIGNNRYKHHLKDDIELQGLIAKGKAADDRKLNEMAARFNNALGKVRKYLKASRKHAHDSLKTETGKLFALLQKQQAAQKIKNAKMAADTRRMRLDAMDAIEKAKTDFKKNIFKLSKVVAANDAKADKNIKELTGVVGKEAAKSKRGRTQLSNMEKANKSELHTAVRDAITKGEQRAQAVEKAGAKMDKDTKWLLNNKLDSEIHKLRDETNAGVESLALQSKEARDEMRKEMLYAIRSAAAVAKSDLELAIADGKKKMIAHEVKATKSHAKSALQRKAVVQQLKDGAKAVARELADAVATDARAQLALKTTVHKKLKKTNQKVTALADQMEKGAEETRIELKALVSGTLTKIAAEEKRAETAVKKLNSEDAARNAKVLSFMRSELDAAGKSADAKFGKQYVDLAKWRAAADKQLGEKIVSLNDALAKQAAIHDARFSKTVKDVDAAKKEVFAQVKQLRKELTTSIVSTTAVLKTTEEAIKDQLAVVSGEVGDAKKFNAASNRHVAAEMKRIETLSNSDFTESKRARGQLRRIMNDNKMAAAEEVKALTTETKDKLAKLRSHSAHMRNAMATDLSKATETWYDALGAAQKADNERHAATNGATDAAVLAASNDAKRAKKMFNSKILMLTNTVASNAESAEKGISHITGVVHNTAKANAADRKLIRQTTATLEADLKKSLMKAISIGTARAKATAQRIAEHQKGVKRFLQVELVEKVEMASDLVLASVEGGRQKIADNYLSLKAYAIAVGDKVTDEVAKGKGRALSSIGDMLMTVGSLGDVPAKKAEGVGMGGASIPNIFGGKTVKVSSSLAAINGLVNEYTQSAAQVRLRWPLGLGKYLMDRFEMSMADKGVLQVDKIANKAGNYVYINGRTVGLSNKLSDFANLAARMSTYESTLSKLTAKLSTPKAVHQHTQYFSKPEWQGN